MKKITAVLSLLFIVGLLYQVTAFADDASPKTKGVCKTNFGPKKKHMTQDAKA